MICWNDNHKKVKFLVCWRYVDYEEIKEEPLGFIIKSIIFFSFWVFNLMSHAKVSEFSAFYMKAASNKLIMQWKKKEQKCFRKKKKDERAFSHAG